MDFLNIIISLAALIALAAVIHPFKPFKSRGIAFISFLGLCVLNAVVAVSGTKKPLAGQETATKTSLPESGASQQTPAIEAQKASWEYSNTTDEMTGATSKTACTTSTNELDFSFPYSGGASGEICFRRKGKALDAWLKMSNGQFSCGIDDCVLKLKFDDGALQSYGAVESTSHTVGMLFFQSEGRLLSSATKAKKLKLQANFFQEGNRVLYFDTAGLDTNKL